MYNIKNKYIKINIDDLIFKYNDKEKFLNLCKKCKNYRHIWSCPPYDFDVLDYLIQYDFVYLIGTKIIFSQDTIEKINTDKKIKKFTEKTLQNVRNQLSNSMLEIEKKYDNSVSLYAGSCLYCKKCTRLNNKPCRNMHKMRYSLESLGFDVSSISNKELNIEIKWSTEHLPEYFTLVSAVLSNKEIINFKNYFNY